MGFLYDWWEERFEIQSIADDILAKFVPAHVNNGWFIKSIHRWSSGVMVLILILHIARVYLTGGFKKPRELIWITGIILAVTSISFGVSGYSLPCLLYTSPSPRD